MRKTFFILNHNGRRLRNITQRQHWPTAGWHSANCGNWESRLPSQNWTKQCMKLTFNKPIRVIAFLCSLPFQPHHQQHHQDPYDYPNYSPNDAKVPNNNFSPSWQGAQVSQVYAQFKFFFEQIFPLVFFLFRARTVTVYSILTDGHPEKGFLCPIWICYDPLLNMECMQSEMTATMINDTDRLV